MADIVISEFMDKAAVDGPRADCDVHHDPALVVDPRALTAALTAARALEEKA